MKNTKKVLSVALAGALAFGSMGAAFAAAPEMDKNTDKKVTEAVERLNAFGIVNGMEDGKYHEEMKVTREQFAKILVEALGLGGAADAAKGATKFSDVEASRWSAGYINVAQGQGLLSGYPDGTFQPAKEVSYAEAVTMLVRALGYKDEFLPGSWPGNYVAKAADTGITDGAKFSDATGTADRGTVAVLVDNALDSNVVKVSEYVNGEIKYAVDENKTLLDDKLDITKYEDVRLVKNERLDDGLNSEEASFVATNDNTEFVGNSDFDLADGEIKVDTVKGINTDELMGLKVKVYVNDDDEVIYMQRDGNETVATDVITKVTTDSGKLKEVELYKLDDEYSFDKDGTTAYVTGLNDKVTAYDKTELDDTTGDLGGDLEAGMFGRFVIENNKVVFADIMKADEANGLIVTKVDTDSKEITGIEGNDEDSVVNLEDDYDKVIIMDTTGKTLELKDIKANNVVYVSKTEVDGDDYAVVTVVKDNEIKGKFTKAKSDEIEIADKSYDLVKNNPDKAVDGTVGEAVGAYFSVNKGEDIYAYSLSENKLEDVDEEEVLAITDMAGRVLYFSTDVKSTSDDIYGVVTKIYDAGERVKVYNPTTDDEITYTLEEDADATGLVVGDFIKFSLNKDGEIADGELEKSTTTITTSGEFGKDSIITGSKTYSVSKDTVMMTEEVNNSSVISIDDLAPVKWADISEDDITGTITAQIFANDKEELDAVFFLDDGVSSAANDEQAAYVIEAWKKGSDDMVKVALDNGDVKEYELNSGTASEENAYVVKLKSNGKLELISKSVGTVTGTDFEIVTGTVYDKDGDYIKLFTDTDGDGKWDTGEAVGTIFYRTDSNTVIYDEKTKKKIHNVTKGTKVDIVVEDSKDARVIEIK
ncbi:S-layer homology domain-containing protein [Tepidibacter mesophilus]|uniref:S-layer homology domain-containing protein n=1 Tax=Tepidibacter mesophilus TaxID=655607 RepID=UPI000C083698|nr:S-layer homology domain-containing protein [Tepidibacter mesophilus]